MLRTVHRQVRQRVYRPRVVDGVAVESVGLRFEHPFSYSQYELDKIRAEAAEKAAQDQPDEAQADEEAPAPGESPEPDSD